MKLELQVRSVALVHSYVAHVTYVLYIDLGRPVDVFLPHRGTQFPQKTEKASFRGEPKSCASLSAALLSVSLCHVLSCHQQLALSELRICCQPLLEAYRNYLQTLQYNHNSNQQNPSQSNYFSLQNETNCFFGSVRSLMGWVGNRFFPFISQNRRMEWKHS